MGDCNARHALRGDSIGQAFATVRVFAGGVGAARDVCCSEAVDMSGSARCSILRWLCRQAPVLEYWACLVGSVRLTCSTAEHDADLPEGRNGRVTKC